MPCAGKARIDDVFVSPAMHLGKLAWLGLSRAELLELGLEDFELCHQGVPDRGERVVGALSPPRRLDGGDVVG